MTHRAREPRAANAKVDSSSPLRPSGIAEIGDLPWGSHLCQFYKAPEDLEQTLVPYFKAGLDNNECCLWVTSEPFDVQAAKAALAAVVSDLDARIENGQIEILDHKQWYALHRECDQEGLIQAWLDRELDATARGFDGLRISGNTSWLEDAAWNDFMSYEAKVHEEFRARRVLALCSYALCDTLSERMSDVRARHDLAIVRHDSQRLREAERASRLRAQAATAHVARLQRLGLALSDATTTREIAELVVSELEQVFAAERAVFLLASEGDELGLVAHSGVSEAAVCALRSALEDGTDPLLAAHRSGVALWLGAEVAARSSPLVADGQTFGAVPIAIRGRRLAVLGLVHAREYVAPALERALLDDYAKQVALALDRAKSHDELGRARSRLQLLADSAANIAQAKLDLDQIVITVVSDVTRSCFADCCAIHLRSEDGSLPLAGIQALDDDLAASARELLQGSGIVGSVGQSGRPVRLTSEDDALRTAERHRITSLVVVPLRASGDVIGTLCASRQDERPSFSIEDEQLLQDLADRAALSIENALLYQHAERERQRAEQERQRAESANRAKDEFLAMLGHELRNPLSPILTAVQLMRLRADDVLEKERTIIERQVNHMVRLVDDLLNVSRITRGKIDLRREPIELSRVVADAIEMASPLLEERSHALTTQVPGSGLIVKADPGRLSQVIANLLTNAAKYTPPGGHVQIAAAAHGERVVLEVKDDGMGIDPALLPKIFELFVQGGQEIDREKGGLGLGLAIARRFAEMHGGTLSARSEGPGTGSVFSLELPLDTSSAAARREPVRTESAGAEPPRARLLVVDDNTDAANVLADALGAVGFTVKVAHDGPSALAVAAGYRPDVALLDIGLPVMDGYELGRRLTALLPERPPMLVAVTGYGQESDRRASQEAGFARHLVKPLDFSTLQGVIASVLAEQGEARASAR